MIESASHPFLYQRTSDKAVVLKEIHDMTKAGKPWWAYGLTLPDIHHYVGNTFPGNKSLYRWVKDRAKSSPQFGMEIGGDGLFLKQLKKAGLTSGICVTLKDFREAMYPGRLEEDLAESIHLVEGSVFRKKTWEQIPQGIDFAISIPVGGEVTDNKPQLYGYVLSQLYERLSSNHGLGLFVLANDSLYHQLIPMVSEQGIDIRFEGNRTSPWLKIWLEKHPSSPRQLPIIG